MAKLIINPTSGAKKEIPVAGKIVSIGRDPTNDLVLSDAMVSRRHAILERRGEQFVIRDNRSSNGTLVNGDRVVSEQPLRDGDLIAIGSARLLFAAENAADAPPPVAPAGPLVTQPVPVQPAPPNPAPPSAPPRAPRQPGQPGLSCVACGAQASPFDNFCRQCGEQLPDSSAKQIACKSCSAVVMLPAKFCGACGKVLLSEVPRPHAGGQAQPVQPAQPAPPQPAPADPGAPAHPPHAAEPARPSPTSGGASPSSVPADIQNPHDVLGTPPEDSGPVGRISGSVVPKLELERAPTPIQRIRSSPRAASRRPSTGPQVALGRPAGFWIRFAAYSVDSFIVSLPVLLATGVWAFSLMEQGAMASLREITPSVFLLPVIGGISSLVLSIVYPVYFWALRGATPGKQIFGLKVVTMSGETPLGWRRAMLRVVGYTINSFVLGIGFLLIALSEDKRGLHDRLADTCVVWRSSTGS